MDKNIDTLASAVRKFISQRNLPSLIEAINSDKNPYDETSYDSDDAINPFHENRQNLMEAIQTEKNEQNIKIQKEADEKPQWKKEDIVPSSPDWAASPEDNVNPQTQLPPVSIYDPHFDFRFDPPRFDPRFGGGDNTDTIGLYDKDSPDGEKNTDPAWKSYNLLSLGCALYFTRCPNHANHRNLQTAAVFVVTGRF